MNEMQGYTRRGFLKSTALIGLGALGAARGAAADGDPMKGLKIGLASYSVRNMSLDEVIALLRKLDLHYVSLKDMHLKMSLTAEQIAAQIAKLKAAGITLMSGGVVYFKNEEGAARRAFEYARNAGMPVVNASFTPAALPLIEKLAREFDIRIAIHNHGPGDKSFPSAVLAYEQIKNLDPHIGLCVDIGHTLRQGEDPVQTLHAVRERLYDVHIKDMARKGENAYETTVIGQGVIDIKGVLKELIDQRFGGLVGLEYERIGPNQLEELTTCFTNIRAALAAL